MHDYLIFLIVDYLYDMLIRWDRFVEEWVLNVFKCMFKIFDPFGISFLVFESDSNRTFLLGDKRKGEVEEIVVHEPAFLLYLLHTFY